MVWTGALLLGLAVVIGALNTTLLPDRVARTFAGIIKERSGWEIRFSSAHFTGPTQLRLRDASFTGSGGTIAGNAPEVHVSFNPIALLGLGNDGAAFGRVDVIHPRLVMEADGLFPPGSPATQTRGPGDAPAPGVRPAREPARTLRLGILGGTVEARGAADDYELWDVEARLELSLEDGRLLSLDELRLRQVNGGISLKVDRARDEEDRLAWLLHAPAESALSRIAALPWRISGALRAEGRVAVGEGLPWQWEGEAVLEVENGEVVWGEGPRDWFAFDAIQLRVEHGDVWIIEELRASRGDAVLTGTGSAFRSAGASNDYDIHLEIAAHGLTLPDDAPIVETFGLAGSAGFTGVLAGSLEAPELTGRLELADGAVWRRPVDRAEGMIRLGPGSFSFDDATITQDDGRYRLAGEFVTGESPSLHRLRVEAERGRIEEVLAAAGIASDARGEFDGDLAFDGRSGRVVWWGDITARRVEAYGQPFDTLATVFTWDGNELGIERFDARLEEGSVGGSGRAAAGALGFDITVERWPIDRSVSLVAGAGAGVSGRLSFSGHIGGTLSEPVIDGRFTGGDVALGRLRLAEPEGAVRLTREELGLDHVRVVSAGGGAYELSGAVSEWRGSDPEVRLQVEVDRASLSTLLLEAGYELPARLLDGNVTGRIDLVGRAARPDARFDLSLSDPWGVGAPIGLRFAIEDGRFRFDRSIFQASSRSE